MSHNFQEWDLSQQFPPYASLIVREKTLENPTGQEQEFEFLEEEGGERICKM